MSEWYWVKNNELGLDPSKISYRSGQKAWWICNNGHAWSALISNRSKGSGCPYCAGRKVLPGYNDLATTNPQLTLEWNYQKNNDLTPQMVTSNSNKKVWWICSKGHEWEALINNRQRGAGCPYCANQKILPGYNDLQTIAPWLAMEWHPAYNGDLTPEDVSIGTNKKIWWMCEFGNEWEASVHNRYKGSGCPHCNNETKTSFAEQAIFFYLRQVAVAQNRCVDFGKEIDIYLPEYKIGIEHNGKYYHENRYQQDEEKVKYFLQKGIRIISVNEGDIDDVKGDVIHYKYNRVTKGSLDWAIGVVFNIIGLRHISFNAKSDSIDIWSQYIQSKKERSFLSEFPHIANEWNYEKNGFLKPDMVAPHSGKKVWWKCEICGREWIAEIADRSNGCGCPECSKEVSKQASSKPVYCLELQRQFSSIREAQDVTGAKNISMCCNDKRKSAGKHPETGEKLHWTYVYNTIQN